MTMALSLQVSFAQDAFVNPSGTCGGTPCFTTISAAVAAASPNDVIQVEDGTYNENVSIDKSLTLQSENGAASTIIDGTSATSLLGTIEIEPNVNDVTVEGFTVEGFDHTSPGLEKAAIYLQGNHSNISILNNTIVADGEAGLLEEYGGANVGLVIDGNTFSGKTFVGAEPAGCGFGMQFILQNVPRQLVVVQGGTDDDIQFTNNMLIGTTGGFNSAEGCEQGNNLATLDASNVTITGNMFTGSTSRYASQLRARGSNTSVSGNTFDGSGLMGDAIYCFFDSDAFTGGTPNTIEDIVAANSFSPEAGFATDGNFYIFPCTSAPAPDVESESKEFCEGAPAADRRIHLNSLDPAANESVVWVLQSAPAAAGYTAGQEFDICDGSYNDGTLFLSLSTRKTIRVENSAPAGTYTFKVKVKNCDTGCETDLAEAMFSITKIPEGLLCDFMDSPDNVDCEGGSEFSYDEGTDTYTLSSEGCHEAGYYRMEDSHGFAGQTICGDAEIIAEVTGVSGGWAGITMREGLGASEKMLQLLIDGTFLTRRELRNSSPGMAFTHQFPTQGKNWLRLTRTGNTFGAYHSTDGVNWQPVIITNIPMSNCIYVGLITSNASPMGTVTGMFQNVSVTGGAMPILATPNQPQDVAFENDALQPVEVFPNPATDEVNVTLPDFVGQAAKVHILNINGQVIKQIEFDEVHEGVQNIDVHALENGTYLMRIESEKNVVSKRFIINGK